MKIIKFPLAKKKKRMRRFCFVMDDGQRLYVIAADFRSACGIFDQFKRDPEEIAAIECH
jgi:hypothetical protein